MSSNTSNSIRVSISTDAIIYLPFYLAYFGDDFQNTPYGPVDVQIVGLKDIRFKHYEEEEQQQKSVRLRGDAFMTLDVLYGIADVGLGDVGFVPILNKDINKSKDIFAIKKDIDKQTIIEKYINLLNQDMIMDNPDLTKIIDKNATNRTEAFIKKITDDQTKLQIVGGLIRKPALKLLLKSKETEPGEDKDLIRSVNGIEKKLSVFSYPEPSTAYHFIQNYIKKSNKLKWEVPKEKEKEINVDFGKELKPDNITKDRGCFSCDFVALRFANKDNKREYKDYVMVDDWTCMDTNILWSGFILDEKRYEREENKDAFRAFFYAIDKCVFKINQFLNNNNGHRLHYFIKEKLTKNRNKLDDVFKVLIADEKITEIIMRTKKNDNDSYAHLDQIIRYFVKDLFYCKKHDIMDKGNFYYQSLNIYKNPQTIFVEQKNETKLDNTYLQEGHIITLMKLRDENANKDKLEDYIKYDIMKDWYKQEEEINKIKNNRKILYKIFTNAYTKFFSFIGAISGLVLLLENIMHWVFILILGLGLVSFFHFYIIPRIKFFKKERFVIDPYRGLKKKRKK